MDASIKTNYNYSKSELPTNKYLKYLALLQNSPKNTKYFGYFFYGEMSPRSLKIHQYGHTGPT